MPLRSSSEEYFNSEKYELKERTIDGPLLPLIERLNEIRRANRSLQRLGNVTFLDTAHDSLIAYAKRSEADTTVVCVNLDPSSPREGLVTVPPELGLPASFAVQDLLTDETYAWRVGGNFIRLGPGKAHVMHVQ